MKHLLSPFHEALGHLLLVGIPLQFGIIPLGFMRTQSACQTMFDTESCSPLEGFLLADLGVRFISNFVLCILVCFFLVNSVSGSKTFHRTLAATSFFHLVTMSWMQHFGRHKPFDEDFFETTMIYHLLAISVSLFATRPFVSVPPPKSECKAWSFPGIAIFVGATVDFLLAAAYIQVLVGKKVSQVFHHVDEDEVSLEVQNTIVLCMWQSVFSGMNLMSLRQLMNVRQLKNICGFMALWNIVTPLLWCPELSPHIQADPKIALTVRGCLVIAYLMGFAFAGKAEKAVVALKDD